jgi:hypothetical protein
MKLPINSLLRVPGTSLGLAGALGLISIAGFATPSLSASAILADVSINIGIEAPPPPPRPDIVIGVSPGPDYVWIGGYWDGSPGHYTWVGGRWDHPPHAHGQWMAPHWDRGTDGHYHQTKGEWRDKH